MKKRKQSDNGKEILPGEEKTLPEKDESIAQSTVDMEKDVSEEPREGTPATVSRRERKKLAKEEKKQARMERKKAKQILHAKKHPKPRKPDISSRQAARLARVRERQTLALGTPGRYRTGMPVRRHFFRTTAVLLAMLGLGTAFVAVYVLNVPGWQSLDVNKITRAPQRGYLFDRDGEVLAVIKGSQDRVVLPIEQIPEQIRDVFIAAEDLRFYEHKGVDVVRLFGALAANLREGGYSQGASTITMQLIRQSHLSVNKTIARKAEEIWLALQLEQKMTKDEILAMYLNYIYFGNGAYGIQAAAQTYFGVDAGEMSLAQSCALAASIKAPSYYAPHVDPERNRARREYILSTMLAEGMITQEEYNEASREELVLVEKVEETLNYGWYADAVLDEAQTLLGMTGEEVLSAGLHIETALSPTHQRVLEKQFETNVFPADASDGTKVQGAAACVDVETGEVLAIVGGRSYDIRRGLNRATQMRRQPGSALKPLAVYAPAINQYGYMTCSVLRDEPTNFNGYKPRNASYTYYGNVSIRTALKSSLNVSTVALMNEIGVEAGRKYLSSVGIPLDDRDSNLALGLGAMTYGVSPVQLAAAYSPFANGGIFYSPHFIRKITDSSGRVLYLNRDEGNRVLKATSAYLMTNLLQTVTSSGTGAKLSGAGTPVAGKTGTVNMIGGGNRDIWMACYNSEIACAFWMGFDNPDSSHKLAGWISGGDNTALMARNYFRDLYRDKTKPQFTRPKGIITLEIDTQSIKWRGEPMLATDLTPSSYRYTEVFAEDNHPTKRSDVWTPPRALNSFSVSHNDAGYPVLVMQPSDNAVYRIQRDTAGESFILTELYGSAGETLYFTDTKAKSGVTYTYRVIPVHAELLNNGVLLEGVQSVQVAQAKVSGGRNLLENIWNFFSGSDRRDSSAVESLSENEISIFMEP